jgi:hypothetical protein
MRKLKVDLAALDMAFENATHEMSFYLDLENGRVLSVSDEWDFALEEAYEGIDPQETDEENVIEKALSALPDGRREEVRLARQVAAGLGKRYVMVPEGDSHEAYRDMEDWIDSLDEAPLQDRLWKAILGRGAFGRFKDVLAGFPAQRERWFEFKDARVRERVLRWLNSKEIEPIIDAAVRPKKSWSDPTARARLLAEVLAFVREAKNLPGITRIALIGSLTTAKADPKDADLLVTVTADADLVPLAKLARSLQGHAQGFNRGGDIFLADPQGNYLGRTCPWRDCRPGIRQSCDALNCGRRAHLHDDLRNVTLNRDLVANPPLELWPEVVTHSAPPADVEETLLQPLRKEVRTAGLPHLA